MSTATPTPSVFLLFIVIPVIIGAIVGAFTDRQSAMRGVMIGGIGGGLLGFFAMILLSSAIMTDSHIDQTALDSELRHLLERHLAP